VRERAGERAVRAWLRAIWPAFVAALIVLTIARPSSAQDRRIEAAAKDAVKHARADFSAADFDGGLARLIKASKACGTIRCSAPTRAALLRDEGVMQLRRGEEGKASALFTEAVRTDRKIDLTPPYDVPDVRAAWDAATGTGSEATENNEPQPAGDFTHTPVAEQAVNTPIPIYVEYSGSEHVATVVAKYRTSASGTEWKRVSLGRVGAGWGGAIPCADVRLGTLFYYVQGFDASGSPNALSGDPKKSFHTAIRPSITGTPPSLPGQAPPVACTGAQAESPELSSAASCIDDSQCNGGACENGHCAEPTPRAETARGFARVWVGFSGSLDVVPLSSASDVCALTSAALPYNSAGYTCTNPDGSDYPSRTSAEENSTLTRGNAGQVSGGPAEGDVRLLVSLDYAVSANVLAGVRAGAVVNTGAGDAAFAGRGFKSPFHVEARGTYVFGADALAHSGFAPLVFVDAGMARFDAGRTVTVTETGIGPLQKNAWHVGGPWFGGGGVGVRYGLSQRIAFTAAVKLAHAFGSAALTSLGPEVGLAYGF
jgi:hypothetical protein